MKTRCAKFRSIGGPPHSQFGQNDSGVCYCVSCAGTEEDIQGIIKAQETHLKDCAECKTLNRVFDIRGTNGSGKSHIVHELFRKFPPVEQFANDNEQIVVNKLDIDGNPVFIIGDYDRVCGGCDGIKTQDEIQSLVEEFAPKGDVVLEGLLVSHTFERWWRLSEALKAKGIPYYFLFLDTPEDVCIERVKARRLARGNDKPYDPANLTKDWHQNRRVKDKLDAVRANTSWLEYRTAPFAVENLIRGITKS